MESQGSLKTEVSPKDVPVSSQEEPYCIFSNTKIITILVIISVSGMISPLSANVYFPALNDIQEDLKTTSQQVNLTVTVYMIFQGLSPAFWGSFADLWGRRPIYLITMLIYCLSCVGLALTKQYGQLLFFRMSQAFGSSSLIAIGAGVVGDITVPSKRAGYYGIYVMGQQSGTVIGPIIGGLVAGTIGWRWLFWMLLIIAAVMLALLFFFVPETLRSLVGNGSGYANPTPTQWLKYRRQRVTSAAVSTVTTTTTKSRFRQQPHFLAPFVYLGQIDILVTLLYSGLLYSCHYAYLISTSSLFHDYYGLTTIQIGLCFIPSGFGSVVGSYVTGKLLDKSFRHALNHYTATHPGVEFEWISIPLDFPLYHARLRIIAPFLWISQCITVAYGWLFHAHVSLAVPIIFQFIMAFGMAGSMTSTHTLMVDLFPKNSASITASYNFIRCILGAVMTVIVDPGIRGVDVGWFFTIIGIIMLSSNTLYLFLLKRGNRYRLKWHQKTAQFQDEESSDS